MKNNKMLFIILLIFTISITSCMLKPSSDTTPTPTVEPTQTNESIGRDDDSKSSIEDQVEELLSIMTIEEKVGQMTLIEKESMHLEDISIYGIGGILSGGDGSPEKNSPEEWAKMVDEFQQQAMNSRLGIPIIYGIDAVHGHNNVVGATIFPHNIGLGAANDPELMKRIGQITANEMVATGIYWNYAPAVSIPHDIRWGRTYEGYSESTEIVTSLSTAYLLGLQGGDLSDPLTVLGTPKHFLGDGGTSWGTSTTNSYKIDQGDTKLNENEMRVIHLPPYISAIENGAQSIMISFSSWNGEKMHGQSYWINDVLKEELGFDGFVVSDWGGIDQIDSDYYTSVVTSINAGVDMNMVPYDYARFIKVMLEAIEAGDISMERIDDAVGRILKVKFELNLFENPFSNTELLSSVGSEEHRAVAREAVAKSVVLLKNDNDFFPLEKDIQYLYIGGSAMDDIGIQSGGWTISWQGSTGDITYGTTILEAIQERVSQETKLIVNEYGEFTNEFEETPSICIAIVGELPYAEGLGDNERLYFTTRDKITLNRMQNSCEKLAVILVSGRPMIVTDRIENWDAFFAVWLPGTEGDGIADVIFGDVPFSGKLSVTWPKFINQLPIGSSDEEPLFPFDFGLE